MLATIFVALFFMLCLSSCDEHPELAQQGDPHELRVVLLRELIPPSENIEASVELSLANDFARQTQRRLRWLAVDNETQLISALTSGQADLALAVPRSLWQAKSDDLKHAAPVFATQEYSSLKYMVVAKGNPEHISTLADLDGELRVSANSAASQLLLQWRQENPGLRWTEAHASQQAQLEALIDETLPYTVVPDSVFYALWPRLPALKPVLKLNSKDTLVWLTNDRSVLKLASGFLYAAMQSNRVGDLEKSLRLSLQHIGAEDMQVFTAACAMQLPLLQKSFERSAGPDFDWHLLAGLAYQESHWDENAVSPTGVAGIMMLTEDTAEKMNVTNRKDAMQSIRGGADYLRELLNKLPDHITNPDRLWFALAAYNVGAMHLEDARILTQRKGGDPDRWDDVKKRLPLLRDPAVFNTTHYGYARGDEPVEFVEKIRLYITAMQWIPDNADADMQRRMLGKNARDLPTHTAAEQLATTQLP